MQAQPGRKRLRRAGLLAPAIAMALAITLAMAGCDGQTSKPADKSPDNDDGGPADAAMIRERVIGTTVTGYIGYGQYSEFFAPDGTIHGSGYRAEWHIRNDRLCLKYDEAPRMDCYRVHLDDDRITWWRDGELRGEGTLIQGNPKHL